VAAGLWAAAGLGLAWPFWAALAGVTAHLFWQAARVDTESATDCLQKFRSNRDLGLLLFAGIVLGKLV
jgi:4-hydroxybenzoate polyprenyltransferase